MAYTILMSNTAPLISVIIPVYNEVENLEDLTRLLAQVDWPGACEWIFIDDASQDDSCCLIERLAKEYPQIRLLRQEKNQGKGAALHLGIEKAKGKVIAIQDADLEYDPTDLPQLLLPILENNADVVYGSRFRGEVRNVHRTFHRMINLTLTCLSNFCSGVYFTDMETCYKVFRADIIKSLNLRSKRFGFEPEVTAYVAKFRLRLMEFPIHYYPRNFIEGKKITWKDGVAALWYIFKCNFIINRKSCLKVPNASPEWEHAGRLRPNIQSGLQNLNQTST